MSKSWATDWLERIALNLRQELGTSYPDLCVVIDEGLVHVRGSYALVHEGEELDRFQIDITWPVTESEAPIFREVGGRIPRHEDRHVQTDGSACVGVPEEWLLRPKQDRTLIRYLQEPVRHFLIWQALVEKGEPSPWNGRSHGLQGLEESYSEMLGIGDSHAIPRYLELLILKKVKGHLDCPCGSGKHLRDCHRQQVLDLRDRIPRTVAKSALDRLKTARRTPGMK
jgi:hypothetical protein